MKAKKILSAVLAIVMALSLSIVIGINAFAADGYITNGTEAAPASESITKTIKTPIGTITPAGNATFTFTAVSVDGTTATATNMPTPADAVATFATTDEGTTTGGTKTVVKETGDLFAGVTFPHAGIYVYTVKENANTFTLTNDDKVTELMDYSQGEYKVTVLVANKADGSGLYLKQIASEIVLKDDGTAGSGKVDGHKTTDATGNDFNFINKFTRQNKPTTPTDPTPTDPTNPPVDPENPTDASKNLYISKLVSGDAADRTKYFAFTATIAQPEVITKDLPTTYTAYIIGSDNQIITDGTKNGVTMAADGKITVTPGTALTFQLKHGERLVFSNLPVGASYTTTETDAQGYTVSTKQVANNGTPVAGTTATIPTTYIAEGANAAEVINTLPDTPITGILVNNLPYIALILVAAGALVAFLVVKSRKKVNN
jgi:hypothetical protein